MLETEHSPYHEMSLKYKMSSDNKLRLNRPIYCSLYSCSVVLIKIIRCSYSFRVRIPIPAVMLFVIRKIKTLPQKVSCQHVVFPCWSSLRKSIETTDALAVIPYLLIPSSSLLFVRLFFVIQRRNYSLTT